MPYDQIRATPQNPALGAIAAALRKAQEFAGQYQVLPQVPLLGGTGVDELLGLPGAAREVENWSYGNYPVRINPNAGRTASFIPEVKPGRKSDLADTMLLGLDVAPLAQLAGKGAVRGTRALEDATVGALQRARIRSAASKVPEDTAYEPLRQRMEERGNLAYAVKPKGGNWLAGSVENAVAPLKQLVDPELEGYARRGQNLMPHEAEEVLPKIAINDWLDTKLAKYMRNEMGTPEDPVRALAERGITHAEVAPADTYDAAHLGQRREAVGFPKEGMGRSEQARAWEAAADDLIHNLPAGERINVNTFGEDAALKALKENPWLQKVPPETMTYGVYPNIFEGQTQFGHLIDELKNAMDPNSTLPANLRFDPKNIDKITVPQAVERVSKINAWRAEQAAQAEKAGMLENLQATPRMADDSFQLSFVDKPGGAWVDIPETVDEKGMKLCNSIGKAGGWCTQQEWAARSYGSGENRLTALVDTEGRPHAQAKITENEWPVSGVSFASLPQETKDAYKAIVAEWRKVNPEDPEVWKALAEAGIQRPAPDITELKPVGNSFKSERAQEYAKRDPDYFRKVETSVLKFLNSGNWGNVADLHHYGIVDLQRDPTMLLAYLRDMTGGDSRAAQALFNEAVDRNPNAPRFMTTRQLREFIGRVESAPPEGFAGGGIVKGAVKSIGELVQKYIAKEAPQAAAEAAPKEQKLLQGFYRGYAGENKPAQTAFGTETYFVSPQRKVADYYAQRRAAETGAEPHAEMILADPFLLRNNPYGLSIPIDKYNRDFLTTRARRIDPDEVKDRTQLYAEGGLVDYDPDEIAQIAERATQGGAVEASTYDPARVDDIVNQIREGIYG